MKYRGVIMKTDFIKSLHLGHYGEDFCFNHLASLLKHYYVISKGKCTNDHIEGCDYRILVLDRDDGYVTPEELDWTPGTNDAGKAFPFCMYEGGVEIKTIKNFLLRNNDNSDPSGTIGFELWSDSSRSKPGWLFSLINPEAQCELAEKDKRVKPAEVPIILIFALIQFGDVIAVIAFEDIPALLDRLYDLAYESGVDLKEIPCGESARDWKPNNMLLINNMWHVSLDDLSDLATVTMVANGIRYQTEDNLYDILQEDRFSCLEECALRKVSKDKYYDDD